MQNKKLLEVITFIQFFRQTKMMTERQPIKKKHKNAVQKNLKHHK